MSFHDSSTNSSDQARYLLVMHSSSETLGVAVLDVNNPEKSRRSETFAVGRLLSKTLFNCVEDVLPASKWSQIVRLAVATGPGGFTGNRVTVVMARTLAQQLGCCLDGVSSFALMAPRLRHDLLSDEINEPFWIIKPLKRRGLVAGQYQIESTNDTNNIIELEAPHLIQFDNKPTPSLTASDNVKQDIESLLDFCHKQYFEKKIAYWKNVNPIYPTSPVE